MKLKDNFFETDEMVLLESMQNGYIYSNILMKMYLKSLKNKGRLMFNDKIPYNANMLATVTRHSVGDVERAIEIFTQLGLIEVMDSGAIYMSEIQNYIGKSSNEADRIREYRTKIKEEKGTSTESVQMYDERTPEIEIDIEKEKDIYIKEKDTKKKSGNFVPPTVEEVREYLLSVGSQVDAEAFVAFYESKGWFVGKNKMKSWKAAIVTWEKRNGLKRIAPKKDRNSKSNNNSSVLENSEEIVLPGEDW